MLQTVLKSSNPVATKSGAGTTLSGKKQAQQLAQSIAKQVAQEPVEILRGAADQILGAPEKKEATGTQGQALQGYRQEPDFAKIQRREARHLQAFREELQEIQKLQQQRAQDILRRKQETEQEKEQTEAQKEDAVPLDAPGKAPKKGGMMRGLKNKASNMLEAFKFKKQRGIETQKMPSN